MTILAEGEAADASARPSGSIQRLPGLPAEQRVQRAVGFEYELDGATSWREKKSLFGAARQESLKKGKVIAPGNGFNVTADEIPPNDFQKGSDVEIVIEEIDDRDPKGQQVLGGTVAEVIQLLQQLDAVRAPIPATAFGGAENDLFVAGAFDSGVLQATVGMDLSALYRFRSGEMGQVHEQRLHALGPEPDDPLRAMAHEDQAAKGQYLRAYGQASQTVMDVTMGTIGRRMRKLPIDARQQLAAVISMIVTIPATAYTAGPVPYPKAAAGTLLARTDLATMIRQLPEVAQIYISDRELWVSMLLSITEAAAREDLQADSPIFPKDSIQHGNEKPELTLTLGEWFGALAPPFAVDKLTKANYPEKHGGKKQGEWLESMGAFGEQMDPALEKSGKERPIVEFRRRLTVPLHHLSAVCDGIWELVHLAHQKD